MAQVDAEGGKKDILGKLRLSSLGQGARIGIAAAVALVVGLLVGKFLLGGSGIAVVGTSTLGESDLDTVVATYTYGGTTGSLTARDVITENGSLEASQNADGDYTVPSADTILSTVRNRILASEAESRGMTVSDDDLTAYADDTLGTSDFASIAETYGMDEDSVKDILTRSALMNKLRVEVVGDTSGLTAPEAPTAPEVSTTREDGEPMSDEEVAAAQEAANNASEKKYATYIIEIAGDAWNADEGTWADGEGEYAQALSEYKVTAKGASYNAAQAAYYVAYQQYSTAQSEVSSAWSAFVNDLLSNSGLVLSTLKN